MHIPAAAKRLPAATFMPASMTGWFILNSLVRGVEKTGFEAGIVGE